MPLLRASAARGRGAWPRAVRHLRDQRAALLRRGFLHRGPACPGAPRGLNALDRTRGSADTALLAATPGGVPERLKGLVSKTSSGLACSWVRIPPPPPRSTPRPARGVDVFPSGTCPRTADGRTKRVHGRLGPCMSERLRPSAVRPHAQPRPATAARPGTRAPSRRGRREAGRAASPGVPRARCTRRPGRGIRRRRARSRRRCPCGA